MVWIILIAFHYYLYVMFLIKQHFLFLFYNVLKLNNNRLIQLTLLVDPWYKGKGGRGEGTEERGFSI